VTEEESALDGLSYSKKLRKPTADKEGEDGDDNNGE
jgi:hypothetical protein